MGKEIPILALEQRARLARVSFMCRRSIDPEKESISEGSPKQIKKQSPRYLTWLALTCESMRLAIEEEWSIDQESNT